MEINEALQHKTLTDVLLCAVTSHTTWWSLTWKTWRRSGNL